MGVQPTQVAGNVNPTEVAKVADDKADNHTPEPIHPEPAPETPANPGAAGNDRLDALEGIVTGLATAVTTLTEVVTGLASKDATPHKRVPWTHKGGGKRNDDDN